jgi:hypothetical protein
MWPSTSCVESLFLLEHRMLAPRDLTEEVRELRYEVAKRAPFDYVDMKTKKTEFR